LVLGDKPVAAVARARVTMDTAGFVGVAEEDGLLPEVKPLAAQQRRYASADFPDWASLRRRWAAQIEELAGELHDGVAAVVFEKDSDLQYCDVLPLLRIAEREAAWVAENMTRLTQVVEP
jgi:exodeoxyribonuclease-5